MVVVVVVGGICKYVYPTVYPHMVCQNTHAIMGGPGGVNYICNHMEIALHQAKLHEAKSSLGAKLHGAYLLQSQPMRLLSD